MNLISKVCVVALVWLMLGIGVYFFTAAYYCVKSGLLNPDDSSNLMDKFFDGALDIIDGDGKRRQNAEKKGSNREGRRFVAVMQIGITWPVSMAVIHECFKQSYERLKNEYGR